jgi:hypothetical protein
MKLEMFEEGSLATTDKTLQDIMDSYLNEWDNPQRYSIDKLVEDLSIKKEELLKLKLTEKGFGHLIEGFKTKMFPKICCVRRGEWELYFADNDTDEGAFIIGFRNIEHAPFSKDGKYSITSTIQWQDTLPLINFQNDKQ